MNTENLTKEDIKTFEDACEVLSVDPNNAIPDFSMFPEKHQNAMISHAKLVLIAEALNTIENGGEPWTPDWTNGEWDKYYPWFDMDSASGVGFSYLDFVLWRSISTVGSRLCFISSSLARYAGNQFIELYKAYFTA
ncbi:hypothetical protein [Yeosuana marina]|uniref:hypothetical protein n=1 Tax=Yeosuana marina TaxID=1565536 RepID=UPI00141F6A64|nr:hypothetical protein [Yeosuana marina]